ncbi:MAG: ABC transporter ATP-binding protein, partial [Anaeroplasmataceae bacterium]
MASKFDDNKNSRKYKDSEVMKRLSKYLVPEKKSFIIAFFLTIVIIIIDLLPPFILGEVIGVLDNPVFSDKSTLLRAIGLVGLFFVLITIAAFINYFAQIILQKSGQRIVYNIRKDVFVHIESLTIAEIHKMPIGKLVTRVSSDVNMVNELFTNIIVNIIKNVLTLVGAFIVMFIISPVLAGYMLLITPILIILSFIFKKYSRNQHRTVRGHFSNMNAFLSENISGMKITQIFNQEEKKKKEFDANNINLKKSQIREITIFAIFRPSIFVLYIASQMIVLYQGYLQVTKGALKVERLVSFYGYISTFFNPIQTLADQYNQLQQAFASSERLFEILDIQITIVDKEDSIELESIKGKIEFKNVY